VIIDRGHVIAQGRVDELLRRQEAIEIELIESEVEQAEEILSGLSWVNAVRREGLRLHVTAPTDRSRQIAEALAASGVYPTQLVRTSSTLEDLFLSLTRDKNRA
jgi:ABC-type multidrug transport system ATPase subunit